MFIKKILSSLFNNFIFFIIISFLLIIPWILINYFTKIYLFSLKQSIIQLKQGIVVNFYHYLMTPKKYHHVQPN
jgi:hypothetical protein